MEALILNQKFQQIGLIDTFESLLWTERFNEAGNFEIYTPVDSALLDLAKQNCYVWLKDSDQTMIIEEIQIETKVDTGSNLIVSGRSLEAILDRRIIWSQTSLDGNLQNGIKKLLDENVINPSIAERKIPGFIFEASDDPAITGLSLRAQYTGDNLYDTIVTICQANNIGFRVYLNDANQFVFTLYSGIDRSYGQIANPYVIFSPKFENIINSDYLESEKTLKNVTLVAGEGEGKDRKRLVVGSEAGIARRELYTDARDVQSEEYSDQLNADQEILDGYEQLLDEAQQYLAEEQQEAVKETEEYNTKAAAHTSQIASYNTRIANFRKRIADYNQMITTYRNQLTGDQKTAFSSRESYKQQIKNYDDLISKRSSAIDSYNDKLKNEKNLSYAKIVEYENAIKSEETTKSGYEEKKKTCDQGKTDVEKQLPNYETTLNEYETMISKYEEIIANDQQSLSTETAESEKDKAEHNSQMAQFNENIASYQATITDCSKQIAQYKQKIAEDQAAVDSIYNSLLEQRGKEKLSENISTKAFTSEIEATRTFVYGKDFFKGDIIQIVNEYGMEEKVRVIEFVRAQDTTGYNTYPTFSVVE